MDKREAIEAEMNSIIHRLTHSGGPALRGNLLDSESFGMTTRMSPRELTRIYKHCTLIDFLQPSTLANASGKVDAVETDLGIFSENSAPSASPPTSRADDMDVNFLTRRPFALVDEIIEGSPAADDGLHLGDQIVKFGNVESGDNLLQKLSLEAQSNVGNPTRLVVMRQGVVMNL